MDLATILLTCVAFVTATISAIVGMGGGILLLATMFCFLPHGDAIPTHALVQLVSNSTRVAAYALNVDWRVIRRFLVGALPGAALAVVVLMTIGKHSNSEPYLKVLIGVYVLAAAYLPAPKKERVGGWRFDWEILGLAAGTSALLVGAVGPLIAPLFARRSFVKERLIATKAMCQMALHVCKIPGFAYLRYSGAYDGMATAFGLEHLGLLALLMATASVPGTLLGRKLIRFVSESAFRTFYTIALTVAGVKVLVFDGLLPLLR